ncbi:MAG TPA: 50S ribosomal protein L23 [Candidatus Saccharimonadales bacterium]|nr:50S ribosomal protein L23 [Candidatus Saccharimonadales bacterium]
MSKHLILRPRLSEKTYGLSESRVYVVDVPAGANKHSVARAVEAQFEVKVTKVNIANIKGKAKRVMSITGKRYSNAEGRRNDIKKAYVTLAEGHSLPFFAAVEEEEQKEQKLQEQVDKAAAKQAAKDEKSAKPRRGFRLPRKQTKAEQAAEEAEGEDK